MRKLDSFLREADSFLREAQRVTGFSTSEDYPIHSNLLANVPLLVVMSRKAMKNFTFSDGTFIPKGAHVAALSGPVHMDDQIYEDPLTFKPFRFAEAREGANSAREAVKNQMVTTSPEHLLFGHGRHAW